MYLGSGPSFYGLKIHPFLKIEPLRWTLRHCSFTEGASKAWGAALISRGECMAGGAGWYQEFLRVHLSDSTARDRNQIPGGGNGGKVCVSGSETQTRKLPRVPRFLRLSPPPHI